MQPEKREAMDNLFAEIEPDLERPIHELSDAKRAAIHAEFTIANSSQTLNSRISKTVQPKPLPPHKPSK